VSDSESSSSEVVAPLRGSSRRLPRLSVDPVQQLLAFEEIRQLPSRYALAVDSRNLDALAELFAPAHGPDQERFLSAMRGSLTTHSTRTWPRCSLSAITSSISSTKTMRKVWSIASARSGTKSAGRRRPSSMKTPTFASTVGGISTVERTRCSTAPSRLTAPYRSTSPTKELSAGGRFLSHGRRGRATTVRTRPPGCRAHGSGPG
jgi:SnoaL-like domain